MYYIMNITTTSNMNTQSSYFIQNDSKQDWGDFGINDEFDYQVISDSHGSTENKMMLIDLFKEIDWSKFLSTDTWCEEIIKKTTINSFRVGATLTVLKIYPDTIECYWIGDSTAKIYEFDEENKVSLLWRTKDHDYNNKNDYMSMLDDKKLFPKFVMNDTYDVQAITGNVILSVNSKYFKIGDESINMTRALGHQGSYSKYGFEKAVINRKKDMTYKIVSATDGFWQVMSVEDLWFIAGNNAEHLARTARSRWGQEWTHDNSLGKITKNVKMPQSNWDDIGVITWSNVV
jgi:serine/threonine protein phosphatase PrpC